VKASAPRPDGPEELALALFGAMCLVLAWRIRAEEALLRREFGAEWEAYTRRSQRLVPFVF
jgi:protein-S-isoprenylcysteine O-methyltransferase Ste14